MEGGYLMSRVLRMLLWQQGTGFYGNREKVCYRDRRWLLWRWEMVAMVMGDGCYGDQEQLLW